MMTTVQTPKTAEVYATLLKKIGPHGVTGHPSSWVYQLMADGTINVIWGEEISVVVTKTSIQFNVHKWGQTAGSLDSMPYGFQYKVRAGGTNTSKGKTYFIKYWHEEVEVQGNGFAVYTDARGLQSNTPVVELVVVASRRKEVTDYVRRTLLLPFGAAKVIGPTKTPEHVLCGDATVVKHLVWHDVQAVINLASSMFALKYSSKIGEYEVNSNPKHEINKFINRNKHALFEAFGVYEGSEYKPPPAA